jgi:NTE family protein
VSNPPERKPDELWIVQINPQEFEGEPDTLERSSTGATNSREVPLNQELHFIERVTDWVDDGFLPESEFSHTEIHRIGMGERFHCSTKVDRDRDFLNELMELGHERAVAFLDGK